MDATIIAKFEEALRAAMLANDVAALDRLLDDDLVFTGPDGRLMTKSEDLSVHRARLLRLDQMDLYDAKYHRIGGLVLVTVKAALVGAFGTAPFRGRYAYSRLWRPDGDGWKVVVGHAASIGDIAGMAP